MGTVARLLVPGHISGVRQRSLCAQAGIDDVQQGAPDSEKTGVSATWVTGATLASGTSAEPTKRLGSSLIRQRPLPATLGINGGIHVGDETC